ncbi:Thioredoxin domain-containing protein [Diplonema papillatum]|nr:Thioredoxin domain-containing protein [Diplonema papillatum]
MQFLQAVFALALCASSARGITEYNAADSDVIALDDSTFEVETQAATGATTGDWLVMFYAPWCGWCKKLQPDWELLASELKGSVNVAKVDATNSIVTVSRFEVAGYPTIYLFSHGKYYKFQGDRTLSNLQDFASSGFKEQEGLVVPKEKSIFMAYYDLFLQELPRVIEEDGRTLMMVAGGASIVGFVVSFLIVKYYAGGPPPPPQQQQAASLKLD